MATPYYADDQVTLWHGDALATLQHLPDESVNCVVTSPPYYGLRDYGEPGQYGLEPTPAEYVETLLMVFAEMWRVIATDGTLWLNLGDSYASGSSGSRSHPGYLTGRPNAVTTPQGFGAKPGRPKDLLGIPWRVAFALQNDGWILRNAIIWDKPNAMPESVKDRCSTTYETVFLFARSHWYFFDLDAIREPLAYPPNVAGGHNAYGATGGHGEFAKGRNPGDVWTMPTQPFPEAHFAVMPPALAERCIVAGCPTGGTVLDPFCGSGTTGMVALKHGRRFVGIDLSARYLDLALRTRLRQGALIEGGEVA
jgi:site-specific DNA-methyltransferase (cytosine-N4-specific)